MKQHLLILSMVALMAFSSSMAKAAEDGAAAGGRSGDRSTVEVVKKAEALAISSFVLGGLNFALTLPGWSMGQAGDTLAIYMLPTFMSSAGLMGAFSTALGKKAGVDGGALSILGWTFAGLSFAGFCVYLGAIMGCNLIFLHVVYYVVMFSACASLMMFGIKALKIKKAAIEKGKNRSSKKVSLAPSLAPIVGEDRAIHGGAIGLSGAF